MGGIAAGTKSRCSKLEISRAMKTNRRVLAIALAFFGNVNCHALAAVDGVTHSAGPRATLKVEGSGRLMNQTAGFLIVGDGGTGLSSTDGLSWTLRVVNVVNVVTNWRSVARGDGIVVAIDCTGQLRSSIDGLNWTLRSSGTRSALHGLAWGKSRFVAVGNEGALVTSDDGFTWTNSASGTDERLRGVAFGDGTFVVVGYAGAILTSHDGARWTRRNSGTDVRLQSVAYGNGMFVTVGWHGLILTSLTGTKWTPRSSGTPSHLRRVTFLSDGIAPTRVPAITERINFIRRGQATGCMAPASTRKQGCQTPKPGPLATG